MPKPKEKNINVGENDLKIKNGKSSLSEFVKRSIPNDEEVEKFDEFAHEEARNGDVEDSLDEIYRDDNGRSVDVGKLEIKKGRGFFFYFFSLIFAALLAVGGYAAYYFLYLQNPASAKVEFSLSGKDGVRAGEEFFYEVDYRNLSGMEIRNIEISLAYPDNFIFLESSLAPAEKNNLWKIEKLEPHRSAKIKVKGKIIDKAGMTESLKGVVTYIPANFSSEFRKEAFFESSIISSGVGLSVVAPQSVLAGEENEIIVKYKKEAGGFINKFRLSVEKGDNIALLAGEDKKIPTGSWQIENIGENEQELKIKMKINDKKSEAEEINLVLELSEDGNKYYKFDEKKLKFEVIKNSLNLTMIINGSRGDLGIDLGQALNYSIAYSNKGEKAMNDIAIMAVLEGGILDWSDLVDKNKGQKGDNTIIWNKESVPQLERLSPGDEGIIDFSVGTLPIERINLKNGGKYEVKSYAQFSVGNMDNKSEETKSNIIISKANSDLKLNEEVRYYNEDNIPVGSGPVPPRVGETTSFKVYWRITNNLHELNDLRVEAELPSYVKWDGKDRTTVGAINYDESSRRVVWDVGRLPVSVLDASAEFSINIVPSDLDRGKILVLLPGTVAEAVDGETGLNIKKENKAKTTKLEDDEAAPGDGRIE